MSSQLDFIQTVQSKRNYKIDFLKGIAIIAVVLYHFGGNILPFGYLGVDIFFVISGYFMMKGIKKKMEAGTFHYWDYIIKRICRLCPLVLLMVGLSLLVGYFVMLPDDYENLGESAVASVLFLNNVLACITTKNYWDIVNLVKPLMHMWYVGVLMQTYVIVGAIYSAVYYLNKKSVRHLLGVTVTITLLSFIAFISPISSDAQKFYYLPFRAFEITLGSLIVFLPTKFNGKKLYTHLKLLSFVGIGGLIWILCSRLDIVPASIKLIMTVIITFTLVYLSEISVSSNTQISFPVKLIAALGRCSFSIYLCHQILIAFMFYCITAHHNFISLLLLCAAVAAVSFFLYRVGEKNITKWSIKHSRSVIIYCIMASVLLLTAGGFIYIHAGVVRDVPELNIHKGEYCRGMHAAYCDRPYAWDVDFEDNDLKKILIVGNSFGRDFANILAESTYSSKIQISYIFSPSSNEIQEKRTRFDQADFVFCSLGPDYDDISEALSSAVSSEKLYVVSNKNFGTSNGIIYMNRLSKDYYDYTVSLDSSLLESTEKFEAKYGDHFINLIAPVQASENSVYVFTDDNKFISQDCRHLTQSGAQYYARILNLEWIIA